MIPHQPARVAHLLKRLARNVAPHVRRLARGEERRGADVVEAPLPLPARLGGRVDELEPLPVDGVDGVADPAALDLDARGAVAEEGGAVGAVEVEHVGVARDGGAEVGELVGGGFSIGGDAGVGKCPGLMARREGGRGLVCCGIDGFVGTYGGGFPFVLQVQTVDALETHACHTAGGDVETGRDGDEVEFVVLAVGGADARLGELLNAITGRIGYIDHVHGVAVELFKVVLLEAGAFDAERERRLERAEELSFARVVHPGAYLLGPEVVHVPVGFHVVEVVFVVAKPEGKPTAAPQLFVEGLPFPGGHVEHVLLREIEVIASEVLLPQSEQLRVERFQPVLLLGREVPFAHGDGHVGTPLEDFDFAGDWAPFLNDLHARCARSDDRASFASDI